MASATLSHHIGGDHIAVAIDPDEIRDEYDVVVHVRKHPIKTGHKVITAEVN